MALKLNFPDAFKLRGAAQFQHCIFILSIFFNPLYGDTLNTSRQLLSYLRGGDYAHPGDRQAIDLVLEKVYHYCPQIQNQPCLDVGSGFGGTANTIYNLGFHCIYGIDADAAAVQYAKEHYPNVQFQVADALDVANLFEPDFFSFIYMFNVLYAIDDKATLLKNLSLVAKPNALLALFDYITNKQSSDLIDLAGKPMYPMVLSELRQTLQESGWEVLEVDDLSEQFLIWYQDLLEKLKNEHETLSLRFSKTDIDKVKRTFTTICERLKKGELGGACIFAKYRQI